MNEQRETERIRTAVPAPSDDPVYDLSGTRVDELQDRIALALTWAPNRPEKDRGSFGDAIAALDELADLARGGVS